jgi:predicted lipoprotein with Yx(FWY)xxD motif
VIGDATGEGVGKVWYTIPQETVAVSNTKDLGDFLVTADGITLYTYAKDTAGTGTCTADCAKNWPPFTVGAEDRLAAGTGITGKLATITRDDKSLQVTYNGMPLYFFAKDKVPGDATGQNVGNVWAVVKP